MKFEFSLKGQFHEKEFYGAVKSNQYLYFRLRIRSWLLIRRPNFLRPSQDNMGSYPLRERGLGVMGECPQ